MKISDENLEGLCLVFLSYGYNVTKEDLKVFLEDKKIDDNEKIRLAKKALDDFSKKRAIEEANKADKVKIVKETLESKIKNYGYDFDQEIFEKGFKKLSKECIYQLFNGINGEEFNIGFKQYKFSEKFLEEFFSLVDFFDLKKEGLYDEILKQKGELYFRINKNNCDINDDCYTYMYEIVEYKNKKYVIKRRHGNSFIVYIPDGVIKEEFVSMEDYLKTFEKVGKIGYKKGVYDRNCVSKFYVLYKNDDMVISRVKYPNRFFCSSIFPGNKYTDDNWCYEVSKKSNYVDITLEEAIEEVIYGKGSRN